MGDFAGTFVKSPSVRADESAQELQSATGWIAPEASLDM